MTSGGVAKAASATMAMMTYFLDAFRLWIETSPVRLSTKIAIGV
jgi:hypothetical protein